MNVETIFNLNIIQIESNSISGALGGEVAAELPFVLMHPKVIELNFVNHFLSKLN